ncbi:hypothetical protein K469DRAFT_684250 [Zopfia rhizophila CBS 207.26]|uniref:FabD/lysophospholipase-like protein n=1 Tax=Zopfia rhizophila CBS 207.26 TaxID=1314779 RepID=A0A6A6EB20_9PEZI|nr:hypothetical protein K469DRAFT_684250 [Zopfia rhizophila CBS 207.26]
MANLNALLNDIPVSRTSSSTTSRVAIQHRGSTSIQSARDPSLSPKRAFAHLPQPKLNNPPNDLGFKPCEACELSDIRTWNCSYCDVNLCDPCWDKQLPHKPGRTGPDGLPHEKGDPSIVKRLKSILTPPIDPGEQQSLHMDDEDTTWFGIAKDIDNQPIFQDYGRYATIMADSTTGVYKLRYPQLVSFIGQTGAGKSTLVKILIDQQERRSRHHHTAAFASPVVGSMRNENVPTSGDVHLYGDPRTYFSEYPMLYADCEGLEGGENIPMSAQYCNSPLVSNERERKSHSNQDHRKRHKIARVARGPPRDIAWANSPEKQKRQYAVTELYPRLLYTFSDVIVFVLRNPKTFESSVLSKLINWASASMEKSLNQPTLPHAVIALNATDMEVDQQEWDPEYATKMLMATVSMAINRDPSYRALREYWIGRGRRIVTMKDLLECYYSSVTVVRIPIKGRYMKIDQQIDKLHTILSRRCSESFKSKRRSRMLSNSEELNVYLQCAFDHFSHDLDIPFNFMDVAFRINPIPLDFGGNILKLAVAIKNCRRFSDPRNIFKELSFMVASCIMLDCVRQSLKGPAEQILEKAYIDYCDNALEDFCAIFWPCTFSNKRGRCVNVKDRHKKGHQNAKGQIVGTGAYESDFTWEAFADDWFQLLQAWLSSFQRTVQEQMASNSSTNELLVTSNLHHANMNGFYQRLGGAQRFVSHSACFCCLREMAEHPLPCGHVLCTPCVKGYGKPRHRVCNGTPVLYTVAACPLHEGNAIFSTPWEVYFKPPLAGVRILSLDGGGVRGIVILEVLRNIERTLGGRIPVQDFFDLIVGTRTLHSTGGIIALGLGIKGWTVQQCISHFMKLVDRAFTPKLSGLRLGKRKYRTHPLEEALKDYFKDEPIFGGPHETSVSYARKVAVTASCETGEQAVIFTNYNRVDDEQVSYRMERPDDPNNELRLWEAARATSAAPTFFRPFVNSRTKEGYFDGAVFHNNPVRIANYESKLIWPDVEECHPDLLLSIGTGHNGADTDGCPDTSQIDRRRFHNRGAPSEGKPVERRRPIPALWAFPEVNSWLNVLFRRVDNILDSESIWKSFRSDVLGTSSQMQMHRYTRLNPQLGFPAPKMDDKSELEKLYEDVRERLATPMMQRRILRIAHRLIASSFHFEKAGPRREADDHYIVQGTICCRFERGSDNLRSLGRFMQKHQHQSFQPYFQIQEVNHEKVAQKIHISPEIIKNMTEFGYFDIGSIVIPVSLQMGFVSMDLYLRNDTKGPHPISGFPRRLADEESLKRASMVIASPPYLPWPDSERPKMAQKRQSLRQKRNTRHRLSHERFSHERPPSGSGSDDLDFPDNPNEVSSWVGRRLAAKRRPPKPVTSLEDHGVFELPGSPIQQLDEEEEALAKALERSEREAYALQRTDTGTYEDELERVLQLSLVVQ